MDSAVLGQLQSTIGDFTESLRGFHEQIQRLASSLQRVATSGFSATTEGNRLSFVWMMFTRQIASVVLPIIHLLIDTLASLTRWFRGLSGDGQDVAMIFGLVATAFKVLGPVMAQLKSILSPTLIVVAALVKGIMDFFTKTKEGKAVLDALKPLLEYINPILEIFAKAFELMVQAVVIGFQALIRGMTLLVVKLAEFAKLIAGSLPGKTGNAIGMAAGIIAKVYQKRLDEMMAEGWGMKRKPGDPEPPNRQVTPTGFGFESLSASFERITSAANKQDLVREGLDTAKKQLEQQKLIAAGVGAMVLGASGAAAKKGDH